MVREQTSAGFSDEFRRPAPVRTSTRPSRQGATTMAGETVSATTIINAPAAAIFAVLADPAIDGTGWVCEPLDRQPLTAAGRCSG